tara:strand:+ start:2843 stop:3208 length:366 start_codon:yes stop_codon:yes gene_type:complete
MDLTETLFGLIAFYPGNNFPITTSKLHPILFKLKSVYPDLFDEFSFKNGAGFSYCDEVEVYIDVFRHAGILELSSSQNPEILEGLQVECERNWGLDKGILKKLKQASKDLYLEMNPLTPVA